MGYQTLIKSSEIYMIMLKAGLQIVTMSDNYFQ